MVKGNPYSPPNLQDIVTEDRDEHMYTDSDLARGLDYNESEMETSVENKPTTTHKVRLTVCEGYIKVIHYP